MRSRSPLGTREAKRKGIEDEMRRLVNGGGGVLVLSSGRRRWLLLSTGTVGRHCFGASAHGATTLSARLLNLRASRRGAVAPLSLSRPFPSRSQAHGSLSWLSRGTGRIRGVARELRSVARPD